MTEIRVIVCGGRDYHEADLLYSLLDRELNGRWHGLDVVVVTGGCTGADIMAEAWADERGLTVEKHLADWHRHGRAAGPFRNQKMLDLGADYVVAFPGGRGTADMVRRAEGAGVPVLKLV